MKNELIKQKADLPKIYVFSAVGGGDGICYAISEDGYVLGSHWCSHEGFALGDLGVVKGSRPDRHEYYKKHYPNGYEMEFIEAKNVESHEGLQLAIEKNKTHKGEKK